MTGNRIHSNFLRKLWKSFETFYYWCYKRVSGQLPAGKITQKPLPADHFNINNTNDNPKRFILLLTSYSGKQIRYRKNQ